MSIYFRVWLLNLEKITDCDNKERWRCLARYVDGLNYAAKRKFIIGFCKNRKDAPRIAWLAVLVVGGCMNTRAEALLISDAIKYLYGDKKYHEIKRYVKTLCEAKTDEKCLELFNQMAV